MDMAAPTQDLPIGRVTFMFTDIEGSTPLLRRLGDVGYSAVLTRHNEIIRQELAATGGVEVATEGDSVFAVHTDATSSLQAAARIQRDIAAEPWPDGEGVRVRMGLHTGNAMAGGSNYVGVDVHRAARVSACAHGGQVVLSEPTAEAVKGQLPEGTSLVPLGYYRLKDLPKAEAIHQLVISGLPAEFPPLVVSETLLRVPEQLTGFVGREEEMATGRDLLEENRLVTLTGPGGTGKTRLSIEIARQFEHAFADGGQFVSLSTVRDPELLAPTILDELGLKVGGATDPAEQLESHLRDKQMLLILDNFEQIITGADLVARLLASAPGLKTLVTSRAPLHIRGERELPVPPLPAPSNGAIQVDQASGWPAIALFADRARDVRPDFALSDENVATISAIANRLDGLPLALELAASRIRALPPETILARLDNKMLKISGSDLPARQQTITETIAWSYELLSESNRRLLERCSVFRGSFGLTEAEKICQTDDADVLEGLIDLTENSLLLSVPHAGEPRFRMLTVIREFAEEALVESGNEASVLASHGQVYLEMATHAADEILTSKQALWLDRLTLEHDNMRIALDRAIEGEDAELAQGLVTGLWRFWQIRGHLLEGEQRARSALALDGSQPLTRAAALIALGGLKYWIGNWDDSFAVYEEALELTRATGTDLQIAEARYNAFYAGALVGNVEKAKGELEETLEMFRALGSQNGVGRAYWGLGTLASQTGEFEDALENFAHAAEELAGTDSPFDLGWTHFMTARALMASDRSDDAREHLVNALETFAGVSDLSALVLVFDALATTWLDDGFPEQAVRLFGASTRLSEIAGTNLRDVDFNRNPDLLALRESQESPIRAAYEEGYLTGPDEAVALARKGPAG